jgi:cytochrome P450
MWYDRWGGPPRPNAAAARVRYGTGHPVSVAALDRARLRELFDLGSDVYASRGGSFAEDPYPTFHRLRESGPVHAGAPHEALGWTGDVFFQGLPCPDRPHFSAYDFETCTEILRDDRHFVTSVPPLPGEPPLVDAGMLFMDGKRHRDYRALVQPSFVPARATWWLDRWVKHTVDQLIDGFADEEDVDLNVELCAPIPLLTITGSFGIDVEDALDVRAAVTSDGRGATTLARLLLPIIAARRESPRDDLISVLVRAELTDEDGTVHRLSDADVLGFGLLLLAAGSGTTWKQMGITFTALLGSPQALAAARDDPAFLRNVVEESVRWTPTDPVFARFVAEGCSLGGVDVPAGAVAHACLAAANRDPARWERPDEFDPFRPMKPHLAFGQGPHTCLGMHVARMEITYAVTSMLDRFPDLRLDPDAPPPRFVGLYERGPDAVPVRLGGAR